MHNIEI